MRQPSTIEHARDARTRRRRRSCCGADASQRRTNAQADDKQQVEKSGPLYICASAAREQVEADALAFFFVVAQPPMAPAAPLYLLIEPRASILESARPLRLATGA